MKSNLCKSVRDCTKNFSLIDFGLLELCSSSFGLISGMFVPKKGKKQVLAAASIVFAFTLLPLVIKLARIAANQEK